MSVLTTTKAQKIRPAGICMGKMCLLQGQDSGAWFKAISGEYTKRITTSQEQQSTRFPTRESKSALHRRSRGCASPRERELALHQDLQQRSHTGRKTARKRICIQKVGMPELLHGLARVLDTVSEKTCMRTMIMAQISKNAHHCKRKICTRTRHLC